MNKKPLILVTNDDGITAPGLRALIEVMNTLGEVVVVAPDSPQSATAHSITVNSTLYIEKVKIDNGPQTEYSCSGTPVDCVKFAIKEILDRRPDICVSGINHGTNSSINVIYSGTMSAALEAGIEGIPAVGFSLSNFNWSANFEASKSFVKTITENILEHGLPEGVVLNVNIPDLSKKEIKGIKVCRQAKAKWEEEFTKRQNPSGRDYYWLAGKFINLDEGEDTDEWALEHGYISLVPVQFDLTAHHFIQNLNSWHLND